MLVLLQKLIEDIWKVIKFLEDVAADVVHVIHSFVDWVKLLLHCEGYYEVVHQLGNLELVFLTRFIFNLIQREILHTRYTAPQKSRIPTNLVHKMHKDNHFQFI